jgi:hypothetical protein
MMSTPSTYEPFLTAISRSAWMVWCLTVTLALMFISCWVGLALVAYLTLLFPVAPSIAMGLIGGVIGIVVGGFHGLWAQRHREIDRVLLYIWMSINGVLGAIGMVIFAVLIKTLFDLKEIIAPDRAVLFGLLYGIICSTIILLCEYITISYQMRRLWPWLGVGWMAWLLWWIGMAYFMSIISGMD